MSVTAEQLDAFIALVPNNSPMERPIFRGMNSSSCGSRATIERMPTPQFVRDWTTSMPVDSSLQMKLWQKSAMSSVSLGTPQDEADSSD